VKFEPLYYAERLHIINPEGDVGIATLWSQVEQVRKLLEELEVDLAPQSARIAVIGNLYGNGLPQMLRNLLWNPQIRYLLALGQDLSGSRQDLVNFFERGIEAVDYLGAPAHRIAGATRIIDGSVTPADFSNGIQLTVLGKIGEAETAAAVRRFFTSLPEKSEPAMERRNIPIPQVSVERFPSEPRSHNILRRTPLEAWEELIFRLVRFGHRSRLRKGERLELQNVKAVIQEPVEEADEDLARYGFSLAHFRLYQQRILDPDKPGDLVYTYGNRLRGYFRHDGAVVDGLDIAARRLRADPETRHAYISLWDTSRDLTEGHGCPCFVSAFFRRFEGKLTLTATFRTHNAMSAWLENVYGLMAIQDYVARNCDMPPGPLTVVSHSISVSCEPSVLENARRVAEAKKTGHVVDRRTGKHELRFDPHGNFTVTVDREAGEIVVEHSFEGMRIGEYRGKTAEAIEDQLARDVALSEISHALYLGREVARKEMELKRVRSSRVL